MKAIHQLSNSDKGRLLADLFPDQKKPIVEAILHTCTYMKENEAAFKADWNHAFITIEYWYTLAAEVEQTIQHFPRTVRRHNGVFSEQLFFGRSAIFTIDCIVKYAATLEDNPQFRQAVDELFDAQSTANRL